MNLHTAAVSCLSILTAGQSKNGERERSPEIELELSECPSHNHMNYWRENGLLSNSSPLPPISFLKREQEGRGGN